MNRRTDGTLGGRPLGGTRIRPLDGPLVRACAWSVVIGLLALASPHAAAQDHWEFSPYRIRVWLALAPRPEMTDGLRDEIARRILQRSEAVFQSTWDVRIESPPAEFATEAALRMDALTVDQLAARAQLTPQRKPRTKPPAEKPAEKPSEKPAEKPETSSAGKPSDGTGSAAVEKPAEPTAEKPDAKPVEKPDEKSAENSAEKPVASAGAAESSGGGEKAPVDATTQSLRELFQQDKLFVVGLTTDGVNWKVRVRELDCRSRIWGGVVERTIGELEFAPAAVWSAMEEAFRAVAWIDASREKKVDWRLRAGGLAVHENSPVLAGAESFWRPYVRMNDRFGEPRGGTASVMPWSFAVGVEREGTLLKTELHTGVKNLLAGRSTSRTQRFALRVRPKTGATVVTLRTADKSATVMSGYDVLAKDPRSEETELLGRTDWRGSMEVPAGDYPLRVLFIRNGGQLLARLPIMPGLEPALIADMNSDDRRLQAEGFVTGMQGKIMDLVARRAIVSTRLKRRATEGKVDEAVKLLEEFKALTTKEQLVREIDVQQVRLTSPNKRTQDKINKLFDDTRKLLDKFVDANQVRNLETEVKAAGGVADAIGTSKP